MHILWTLLLGIDNHQHNMKNQFNSMLSMKTRLGVTKMFKLYQFGAENSRETRSKVQFIILFKKRNNVKISKGKNRKICTRKINAATRSFTEQFNRYIYVFIRLPIRTRVFWADPDQVFVIRSDSDPFFGKDLNPIEKNLVDPVFSKVVSGPGFYSKV